MGVLAWDHCSIVWSLKVFPELAQLWVLELEGAHLLPTLGLRLFGLSPSLVLYTPDSSS